MRYIHVRNIEKYQMGYKDRRNIWAKIHLSMVQGDEQAETLGEIEWARLVKFIVLETCRQKPTPIDERFLNKRGFDFGIQPLNSTLNLLSHFIDIIEDESLLSFCNESVPEPEPRLEESREEKKRVDSAFEELWAKYPNKDGKREAYRHFSCSARKEADFHRVRTALENYLKHLSQNTWKQPKGGKTWFNNWQDWEKWVEPQKQEITRGVVKRDLKPNPACEPCGGTGKLPTGVKCWCWT